ncbi:DELTA-thalatoxin-Avl1a [Thalassophryne amazonica]|uniref:DELTA-thalatoxin-Avl1a n=1 Tax=Thalassophryne amazonica TaxID=390379 RepID=UPI0014711BDE|nr:DELTA-thalatoxin-Avl1a [Thalassophryne amazonica]XP_034049800.1 DELTA-thalatoxin-Avl1a [Thalassophryne amazonica]XP_034049801.1 DELTA-thalatoxin-Avl1a [Thalassophryne amazonica]XP_034049802.1 DELTA-thalatoxin-Avl1a [Thalassophryne amazonica]
MPENVEAHYHSLPTNRNCAIEITNISSKYWLTNPKVFMKKGFSFSPPQPSVLCNKTEVCSFVKDDNTATGAVGVLTYEMLPLNTYECDMILAVMFSVPFDYNLYSNWLGVGLFNLPCETNEDLYDSMYKGDPAGKFVRQEADGSGIMFNKNGIDVRGTMSNEGRCIVKLELFDEM